ncbi:MAG TPA: hypothetical protein VI756_23220, partial [Blastocatellia bacterium]
MAAYLYDHLDDVDLEIAHSHLEDCDECANELFELRALERLVQESGPKESPEIPSRSGPQADASYSNVPITVLPITKGGPVAAALWTQTAALAASWVMILVLGVAIFLQHKQIGELRARASLVGDLESSLRAQTASLAELHGELESLRSAKDGSSEASAVTVADLKDAGGEVTLDANGKLKGLGSLPLQYEALVRTALVKRRAEIPGTLKELVGKGETVMGGGNGSKSFSLLSPVTEVVSRQIPIFRWRALPGASSYVVAIFDSKLNKVTESPVLSQTEWTPGRPLMRGATYSWQVTATKDANEIISPGAGAPDAKFKVLGVTEYEELVSAQKTYQGSHLLLGILYARAGLLEEARREFVALQAANPNSPLAKELLRSVHALG